MRAEDVNRHQLSWLAVRQSGAEPGRRRHQTAPESYMMVLLHLVRTLANGEDKKDTVRWTRSWEPPFHRKPREKSNDGIRHVKNRVLLEN